MKLSDISDLSKDDVLAALGLSARRSTAERWLGAAGIFGVGLLIGAGVALLLAPKSGQGLREDLGERLRRARDSEAEAPDADGSPHPRQQART
jgi:hypothetical protein